MEKDKIFFDESNGLTSTSANFIANIAGEMSQRAEEELANIQFYNETVKPLFSSEITTISTGTSNLDNIEKNLNRISILASLISWMREAVKARENLKKEVEYMSYKDFGIEYPEKPVQPAECKNDDIIATWTVKERNHYFFLLTMCSKLGKFIHPDRAFSRERLTLQKIVSCPNGTSNRIDGTGRDALCYTRTPSISASAVEDKFFELQQKYRSYQAQLNSILHQLECTVEQENSKRDTEYETALREYKTSVSIADNLLKQAKQKELSRIQNLKIIIPNDLLPIYNEVAEVGKRKK